MFLSGKPLRSWYRVMARDGRVIWFHCEARLVRREDGRPWFIHGVGVRYHRTKEPSGPARGAEFSVRDFRYGGRAGGGAG